MEEPPEHHRNRGGRGRRSPKVMRVTFAPGHDRRIASCGSEPQGVAILHPGWPDAGADMAAPCRHAPRSFLLSPPPHLARRRAGRPRGRRPRRRPRARRRRRAHHDLHRGARDPDRRLGRHGRLVDVRRDDERLPPRRLAQRRRAAAPAGRPQRQRLRRRPRHEPQRVDVRRVLALHHARDAEHPADRLRPLPPEHRVRRRDEARHALLPHLGRARADDLPRRDRVHPRRDPRRPERGRAAHRQHDVRIEGHDRARRAATASAARSRTPSSPPAAWRTSSPTATARSATSTSAR